MKKLCLLFTLLLCVSSTSQANEQSVFVLKNLERERAALLTLLLNDAVTATDRQLAVQSSYGRLVSAEQMALRFDQAPNEVSQLAKQIFTQYDLSFMLHASSEHSQTVIEHWFNQLSLTTQDIEQGFAGER